MSEVTENGKVTMMTETGIIQGENSMRTDVVMEGMDVQHSPSPQDGARSTANARAIAYQERILEVAGRIKEPHKA